MALATVPARRRPACVFTPHGWSWLGGGPGAPLYRAFERAAARRSEVIVAVSEEEARVGRSVLGARGARLTTIANGVDVEAFAPSGPTSDRGPEPLLVCVGRLCRAKGQDVALQALARLPDPVRLRLVGGGPDEDRLRALAAQNRLSQRVEFIGPVTDTASHLRAADVVVVPSRWDGMSLTLLEAMSCGAAIVATDVPGAEALSDGAGVVVPPQDPDALASAVASLVADPGRRDRLGSRARQRVLERFGLPDSLQRMLAVWDELAA
jgi:glycosyltransferase involved in cell wall biosynthesis